MLNSSIILVIDDTPSNLEVLTEILSSVGYIVATATSGERALKRLQTCLPDLILLDVQMPGMDGFETCQQIKANPETAHIPIIFITILSDVGSMVRGFSLGAVDYVNKPFQELELLTRVNTHLRLQQVNRTLEQKVAARTQQLEAALTQLRESQLRLIQQEKMSALGNLVSGMAYEISNPICLLTGNLPLAGKYSQDLLRLVDLFLAKTPQIDSELQAEVEAVDLEFLRQDMPQLFESMTVGTDRIQKMSTSLRIFSQADGDTKVAFNLHEGLDSALLILTHRLRSVGDRPEIEVIKHYGNLPEVDCFPGQINQVFMAVLNHAVDALEARFSDPGSLDQDQTAYEIMIKTTWANDTVLIHIRDNGAEMPEALQQQFFGHHGDEDAEVWTRLEFAIAKQIICEKHSGQITVDSTPGIGTEFTITLPLYPD